MRLGTLSIASFIMLLVATAASAQSKPEETKRPDAEDGDAERREENAGRSEAGGRDRQSDSFTPSERIRADTTVPFPADI